MLNYVRIILRDEQNCNQTEDHHVHFCIRSMATIDDEHLSNLVSIVNLNDDDDGDKHCHMLNHCRMDQWLIRPLPMLPLMITCLIDDFQVV